MISRFMLLIILIDYNVKLKKFFLSIFIFKLLSNASLEIPKSAETSEG
jgi:hypothetical protein